MITYIEFQQEEADAKKAAEKERRRQERAALREAEKAKRKEELGDEYVSEEEEEEVEEEEEETPEEDEAKEGDGEDLEEKEEKPAGPSPILAAFYQHDDHRKFWVSMGGYDAGYLYGCSLENAGSDPSAGYEAPNSIPLPPVAGKDMPFHSMTFRWREMSDSTCEVLCMYLGV